MANQAKILLLDIETAPSKVYTWGLLEQVIPVTHIIQNEYMICWSAKWLNQQKVYFDSIVRYPKEFKKNPTSDKKIAESIWKLIDEADIVITHNGNRFDLKWINTVFLKNGLSPASPFKSIDTLTETKSNFRFISYKLEHQLRSLDLGEKLKHEGFSLWIKCMAGDRKAWAIMERYNRKDVTELEKLYNYIKPFIKNHPNLGLYTGSDALVCPNCAGREFFNKGFAYTSSNKYRRYKCKACGKHFRGKEGLLTKEQRKALTCGT